MRKRPGMYIGSFNYKGIRHMFADLFKVTLQNSKEPLTIEWIMEDDVNCSFRIYGGFSENLKAAVENFTRLEVIANREKYPYYLFFLYMQKIEVSLVYKGTLLSVKKEEGNLIYNYEECGDTDRCFMKFTLDSQVFRKQAFLYEPLMEYVKQYAYQYPNLTMIIRDERILKQLNTFHFANGLQDKLDYLNESKNSGNARLWEAQHSCTIDGCRINVYFFIAANVYIQRSRTFIYADDDVVLSEDETIRNAIIKAMKQSMVDFSIKNQFELEFKESHLSYITDIAASIYGDGLVYGGSWRTYLIMPELKENLTKHMKDYFDKLFISDTKYIDIINKIGFKKGNTLFLDAVFPPEE